MAKLYGLANYIITEMAVKLMTHPEFSKFVYYKDINEDGESILDMPDLESPIEMLTKKDTRQVFLHRRADKILHKQDVNVFIHFDDQKNYKSQSKKLKTVYIKIGLLLHEKCLYTPNGGRDVCILSAIEDALDGKKFVRGLGVCEIERINPLYGIPVEYNGFEVLCRIDGFTNIKNPVLEEPKGELNE